MTEIDIADWRRHIFALYAAVRATPSKAGWQHWRDRRAALFTSHPASLTAGNAAPILFDYDSSCCLNAKLQPFAAALPAIAMDTGNDGTTWIKPLGKTDGLAPRLNQELTAYWITGYGGGLFLPFRDPAADVYSGGRYLRDTIKGADLGCLPDGRMKLDFNFAFNPSCAYSAVWVCPLPPSENWLTKPVNAGEKSPLPSQSAAL